MSHHSVSYIPQIKVLSMPIIHDQCNVYLLENCAPAGSNILYEMYDIESLYFDYIHFAPCWTIHARLKVAGLPNLHKNVTTCIASNQKTE